MAELYCETCKRVVWEGPTRIEALSSLSAAMVHLSNEHPSHRIILRSTTPDPPQPMIQVAFACQVCKPSDGKRDKATYAVPAALLTLVAISWHSEHEGHKHTVHVDGVQIHPSEGPHAG